MNRCTHEQVIKVRKICLVLSLIAGTAAIAAARQGTASKPDVGQAAPAKARASAPAPGTKQPKAANYSDQSFIYEKASTEVSFRNDGTSTEEEDALLRVQSEAAVQKFGILDFYYDGGKQRVEIKSVEVRKPDGSVVTTTAGDIHDLPAPVSQRAPLFSDFRIKEVTVRGLAPGDLLAYQVVVRTRKATIPGQFWFSYAFARNAIALNEELRISVPKGRKVIVKSRGAQPAVSIHAGRRVYFWKTENLTLPKARKARLQPPPSVLLSTFHSWAQVGRWWASLAAPAAKPTPAIRAKAAELTRGATSEREKLFDVYQYVATQFRYISVSFGVGHYEPHRADEVLQNGFGDCKDKATLLVALLDAAGIHSYPALVSSKRRIDPDVPSPGQFDHVINTVPESPKPLWLDTTTEVAPMGLLVPGLRGRLALVVPPKKTPYLTKTPPEPPFASLQEMDVDAKMNDTGTLTAKMAVKMRGDAELLYRTIFRSVPQARWQALVQRISYLLNYAGTVSDVAVSSADDLAKPFSYSYDYKRENYPEWSGGQIAMPLPPFALPAVPAAAKKPARPVKLGAPGRIVYRATIQLPTGRAPQLPKPVRLQTSFATYQSTYSFTKGAIIADRQMVVLTDKLPASSLDAYKKFRKAVDADATRYIRIVSPGVVNEQKADSLLQQAGDALQNRDFSHARDLCRQALKLNPKIAGAWLGIGQADFEMGDFDDAMAAFKKEIAGHPKEEVAYNEAAHMAFFQHNYDEALTDMRKVEKLDPKNASAHSLIGSLLSLQGKYVEGAQEIARAVALDPRNKIYRFGLADSYLKAGEVPKALAAFSDAAKNNPNPSEWNNISYTLAEAGKGLPEAHQYAERAVAGIEKSTANVSLDKLQTSDLHNVNLLAAYWDTLGWVDYRQGNLAGAGRYLRAGWFLSQDPVIGYHLGRLEEKLGRKRQAIRIYAMARANAHESALPPTPSAGGPARLMAMAANESTFAFMQKLDVKLKELLGDADGADAAVSAALPRLNAMRTAKMPLLVRKSAKAEFFLLQSSPNGAVTDVRFISGDKSLAGATKAVAEAKFAQPFPDSRPVRIVRRGVLSCSALVHHCQLVLYLPGSVRGVH